MSLLTEHVRVDARAVCMYVCMYVCMCYSLDNLVIFGGVFMHACMYMYIRVYACQGIWVHEG